MKIGFRVLSLVWVSLLFLSLAFGQSTSPGVGQFSNPQIPSPQVSSFKIYGDIPVSLHTGVPQISIPLFTISEADLSHSISLNYHSSGIKVDQVASWVGLGWNLSAGGVITREIRGISDDGQVKLIGTPYTPTSTLPSDRGWIANKGLHPIFLDPECLEQSAKIVWSTCASPTSVPQCQAFYADAANGFVDTEPDIYTLSIDGFSGKFIFDQIGQPRFLTDNDFEVVPILDVNDDIESWKVISPSGISYYFGGSDATEETHVVKAGNATSQYTISTQSWYLTKVENLNQTHSIDFSYVPENYAFTNASGHSAAILCGSCGGSSSSSTYRPAGVEGSLSVSGVPNVTYVFGLRLDEITTSSSEQKIEFVAGSVRTDLTSGAWSNNTESKYLAELRFTAGTHTQRYSFEYGYFTGSATLPNGASSDHDRYRLKLLSIQKDNLSDLAEEPAYQFTYDETLVLPRRLSLARDHWGYYNGALSNSGLIPSGVENPCVSTTFSGLADRSPSTSHMKAGILTGISYPTGGETIFEYEAHVDGVSGNTVGGLRVKSVTNKDTDGSTLTKDTYTYESGLLYAGYPDQSNGFIGSYVINVAGDGLFPGSYTANGNICEDYLVMGTSYTPFTSTSGYHIGYGKVTKTQYSSTMDNGSEIFHYDNQLSYVYSNDATFPILPSQTGHKLGTLLKHEIKDKDGNLTQETVNTYVFEEQGGVSGMVTSIFQEQIENPSPGVCGSIYTLLYPIYRSYELVFGKVKRTSNTSTLDGVTTTVNYEYSDVHNAVIQSNSENSDGVLYRQKIFYPQDYFSYTSSGCLDDYPNISSEIAALESGLQSLWDDPNNFDANGLVLSTTNFTSDYNAEVSAYNDDVHGSSGVIQSWETCRSTDYSNWASNNGLASEFIDRNLHLPLKSNTYFSDNGGSYYLLNGADSIRFDVNTFSSVDYLQPEGYFALKVDATGGGGSIWEERKLITLDDNDLIVRMEEPFSGVRSANIWDTRSRIVASISNASAGECAYSGFEIEDDYSVEANGGWAITNLGSGGNTFSTTAFSGLGSLDLTTQRFATKTLNNGKKYILSFWAENAPSAFLINLAGFSSGLTPVIEELNDNGWTYYEYVIDLTGSSSGTTGLQLTGSGSASGANLVDELRLYPNDVMMVTYTYNSADLLESVSDSNGKHIFYEYDGLNRLTITRDQDGNIIQRVQQIYSGQPNN